VEIKACAEAERSEGLKSRWVYVDSSPSFSRWFIQSRNAVFARKGPFRCKYPSDLNPSMRVHWF